MNEAVLVENLSVKFGDFFAVNDISFNVNKGEIFGFLGANGAGKTTTIRVLCGLLIPTSGNVRVAGLDVLDGEYEVKRKVGYMSQKFTLYNDLSVAENLSFIASLHKLEKSVYERRQRELFEFIAFERSLKTIVHDLPSGVKQQVSLAAALLHDPEIIFLDEPTAGVSPAARARFWSLIRQLATSGKTVFVTTHFMDEAEQCERIALMREGKIAALNTPEGLKRSAFPMPMLEFEPKQKLSFEQILTMQKQGLFYFFEAYGFRFHAAIKDEKIWREKKNEFEDKFNIREITPTLEDVFIHVVEAKRS